MESPATQVMRTNWAATPMALLLLALLLEACSGRSASAREAARLAEGKALYEANCAACHGAHGEGQPEWRAPNADGVYPAPPHDSTGHTWHHADELLLEIVAQGGGMPNSQMPGYAETLTEDQMALVLAYIKSFLGRQEREFQAEMTRQAEALKQ